MNLSGIWYQLPDGTLVWSEPTLLVNEIRGQYPGLAWYALRPDRRWREGPRKTPEGIQDQLLWEDKPRRLT